MTAPAKIITRFAPSPTGDLHLGNMRAALFNWLAAKQTGGVMQLRLEDTDRARHVDAAADNIAADLHWLGLDFAGDAARRPWRQSARADLYQQQLERLQQTEAAYPCFCSPEQLAAERAAQLAAGRPPRYGGACAKLAPAEAARRQNAGQAAAWRFRVPQNDTVQVDDLVRGTTIYATNDLGDFIVRRADGGFAFLFVNAVDDALLGVTHALRGEDHVSNTPRQLLLLAALNLPAPQYGHLPLMVGAGGKPLSKRDGLAPMHEWRARGFLPIALTNYLARVGHAYAQDDLLSMDDLIANFSLAALGRAPAQYDHAQLLRRQKEAVLQLPPADYRAFVGEQRLQGIADPAAFCALTQQNITLPEDTDSWTAIIAETRLQNISEDAARIIAATRDAAPNFYPAAAAAADAPDWQTFCQTISQQTAAKGKALFLPLRAALTGRTDGPPMPPIYNLLTPQQRRARLEK